MLGPVDQFRTRPGLECLDAPTECGLSDVARFRSSGKMAKSRNRGQVFQPF